MKLARSADKRLRIRSINHAANLGSRGEESNRNMGLFQGRATITTWMGLAPFGDLGRLNSLVLWAHKEVHSALS